MYQETPAQQPIWAELDRLACQVCRAYFQCEGGSNQTLRVSGSSKRGLNCSQQLQLGHKGLQCTRNMQSSN